MWFSRTEFNGYVSKLNQVQKRSIFNNLLLINLLILTVFMICIFIIHDMKVKQGKFIRSRTVQLTMSADQLEQIDKKKKIAAKVYMLYVKDLNIKDAILPVTYALSLSYKQSDFPNGDPIIGLANGTIKTDSLYSKTVENGTTNMVRVFDAEVEPIYLPQLFPLDDQVISVRPAPKNKFGDNYYVEVTDNFDETFGAQTGDYDLAKVGYINKIESYSMIIGNNDQQMVTSVGRAYMVFDHKNIYTYIKNIQYVILSMAIALFSLLINSKHNSPKNGRVAVIGSSVFSLAANVFQINATIRTVNALTLIDLVTMFAGLIILLCFLITVRTLKYIDREGYEASKIFDLLAFGCLLFYIIVFFTLIYWYA